MATTIYFLFDVVDLTHISLFVTAVLYGFRPYLVEKTNLRDLYIMGLQSVNQQIKTSNSTLTFIEFYQTHEKANTLYETCVLIILFQLLLQMMRINVT